MKLQVFFVAALVCILGLFTGFGQAQSEKLIVGVTNQGVMIGTRGDEVGKNGLFGSRIYYDASPKKFSFFLLGGTFERRNFNFWEKDILRLYVGYGLVVEDKNLSGSLGVMADIFLGGLFINGGIHLRQFSTDFLVGVSLEF